MVPVIDSFYENIRKGKKWKKSPPLNSVLRFP
jgi:hypothetical protein